MTYVGDAPREPQPLLDKCADQSLQFVKCRHWDLINRQWPQQSLDKAKLETPQLQPSGGGLEFINTLKAIDGVLPKLVLLVCVLEGNIVPATETFDWSLWYRWYWLLTNVELLVEEFPLWRSKYSSICSAWASSGPTQCCLMYGRKLQG